MSDPVSEPDKPDFEASLGRLEQIVENLEAGELALDAALELFEEGVRLSRLCHGKLEAAEKRVELLLKDASGNIEAVPLEDE